MITLHTPVTLRAFEAEIATLFEAGHIPYPVHLSGGNEEQLIDIFGHIEEDDYIACSWRSHLHALLKGVPEDELRAAILAGRSIALCFAQHRMISSAIVGGVIPIAVGLALAAKRLGQVHRVWCFLGNMTARTGTSLECLSYAYGQDLPITFVGEYNGYSVLTPTEESWGRPVGENRYTDSKSYRVHQPLAAPGHGKVRGVLIAAIADNTNNGRPHNDQQPSHPTRRARRTCRPRRAALTRSR